MLTTMPRTEMSRILACTETDPPTLPRASRGPEEGRAMARIADAPLRRGNRVALLHNGPDAYTDMLAAIARAQRWIHLEDYTFRPGEIGDQFAAALMERVAAGVRVRILYDWVGSAGVPSSFWRGLRRAGVDVRPAHPPSIAAPLHLWARDHSKLLGVDGAHACVGGIGIADTWLQHSRVTGLPYRDTAVRVAGPAVADLERHFASAWDGNGPPLPADERPDFATIPMAGEVAARVIGQDPWQTRSLRAFQFVAATAERRLWIADAYFVGAMFLSRELMTAARDGVDVRILLPGHNDVRVVGALSRAGYRELLDAGVRIYEYAGLMMHAKTMVADGWWGRVGSTNLNPTGLVTNWEVDFVAEDHEFGAAMEAMYEDDLGHAREIRLTGPARRCGVAPIRPESAAERHERRQAPGHGVRGAALAARLIGLAFKSAHRTARSKVGNDQLRREERLVVRVVSASAVAFGLIAARWPRLAAWPLAALGIGGGGLALAHSFRAETPAGGER